MPDDYSSKIRIIASISNDDWREDLSHYNIEYAVYSKKENPLLGNWRNVSSNYLLTRPMEDDLPFYLEADDDFVFKKKENFNRNSKLINDLVSLAEDNSELVGHDMSIICKYMEQILTPVKDSMGREVTKLEYNPNTVDDWNAKGRRGFGELHPDVGKKNNEIPTIPCEIQGISF